MLRRALVTALALLRVRLELAGVELQQELDRVLGVMACLLAAVLLLCFGATFGLLAITLALWETQRLAAMALGAVVFAVAGAALLLLAWRCAQQRPAAFAASAAQLAQDGQRLQAEDRAA